MSALHPSLRNRVNAAVARATAYDLKQKQTKKSNNKTKSISCCAHREWSDPLVTTNAIYVFAALISLLCGQRMCFCLQVGAAVSSTMFHRTRETRYLAVDASMCIPLAFVWTYLFRVLLHKEWFGFLAMHLACSFVCTFAWLYCGMPGGPRYDTWHAVWHYASGITTIFTSIFLMVYMPSFDLIVSEFLQSWLPLEYVQYLVLTTASWLP